MKTNNKVSRSIVFDEKDLIKLQTEADKMQISLSAYVRIKLREVLNNIT